MDTLSSADVTRLCTHLRNLSKAAEVLGCARNRKVTRSADVTLANLPAGAFVQFKGSDGSELEIPAAGLDGIPEAIRFALVGLRRADYALAGTSAAQDPASDRAALQEEYARADKAEAECRQLRKELTTAAERLSEYRENLSKRNDYAMTLELQLESALSGVKGDDAQARRVDELTRENAALQRTVDKLRESRDSARRNESIRDSMSDVLPVREERAAPDAAPVTVPASGGILDTLRQRADVTVSADGRRVEFHKAQGYGVADRLKAEGFRYSQAEHKEGRKVWLR